jgi:hypothetical protein
VLYIKAGDIRKKEKGPSKQKAKENEIKGNLFANL